MVDQATVLSIVLVAVLVLLLLVLFYSFAVQPANVRRRLNEAKTSKVFSGTTTIEEFATELEELGCRRQLIERVDLDRIDVDNFTAVLLRIFQRRARRRRSMSSFSRWWLSMKGYLFGGSALDPTDRLHCVVVGRRFSSRLSHMVFSPAKKCFELEIWDDENTKFRIVEVPPKELGQYIKQREWEGKFWDPEEEEMLVRLHGAHLRACLTAAGVQPWEYEVYRGGIAALAGLSCHVHSYDFEFLAEQSKDCLSFELTPGKHIGGPLCAEWRAKTPEQRKARFRECARRPPPHLLELQPLEAFNTMCCRPDVCTLPIALYLSSPMTACAASFMSGPGETISPAKRELAKRVVYINAMSAAWDGSKNLLGACFNNAVDYEASKRCCAKGVFPNARFVMIPTETCKAGPFTLKPEDISSMKCSASSQPLKKVLVEDITQWLELKRNEPQPLFDAVTMMPLLQLVTHAALVHVDIHFGRNRFAVGTMYEDLGMTLRNADAPVLLRSESECGSTRDEDPDQSPSSPSSGDLTVESPRPLTLPRSESPGTISRQAAQIAAQESPLPSSLEEVRGRLSPDDKFPGGVIYATERVFTESCAEEFKKMFESILEAHQV